MRVEFKATSKNTGPVTINERRMLVVKKDGKPLMAGDIAPNQVLTIDRETGEIISVADLDNF